MFRTQGAIDLRLEATVEVSPVEQPGDRVGLREPVHRLTLLALQEAGADVARQELEGHEVGLAERLPVDRIGDVQHAARLVVDEDRDREERRGAVTAEGSALLPRGDLVATDQERALRGRDGPDDALALTDPDQLLDLVGDPDGVGDHEIRGGVLTEEERRPLSAHKFGRDLEDRVQKIFRKPSRAHGPNGVHHCSPYARSPECPVAD